MALTVTCVGVCTDNSGAFVALLKADNERAKFVQTAEMCSAGIGVKPYGAILYDGTDRTANAPAAVVVELDGVTKSFVSGITKSGNKMVCGMTPGEALQAVT